MPDTNMMVGTEVTNSVLMKLLYTISRLVLGVIMTTQIYQDLCNYHLWYISYYLPRVFLMAINFLVYVEIMVAVQERAVDYSSNNGSPVTMLSTFTVHMLKSNLLSPLKI